MASWILVTRTHCHTCTRRRSRSVVDSKMAAARKAAVMRGSGPSVLISRATQIGLF
jgi:hypothetical protein